MIMWSFWTQKEPNKASSTLLQHTSTHHIAQVSKERLGEFHAIQPILKTRVSQPRVRWKPPHENLAKTNFDGAIFSEANKS